MAAFDWFFFNVMHGNGYGGAPRKGYHAEVEYYLGFEATSSFGIGGLGVRVVLELGQRSFSTCLTKAVVSLVFFCFAFTFLRALHVPYCCGR